MPAAGSGRETEPRAPVEHAGRKREHRRAGDHRHRVEPLGPVDMQRLRAAMELRAVDLNRAVPPTRLSIQRAALGACRPCRPRSRHRRRRPRGSPSPSRRCRRRPRRRRRCPRARPRPQAPRRRCRRPKRHRALRRRRCRCPDLSAGIVCLEAGAHNPGEVVATLRRQGTRPASPPTPGPTCASVPASSPPRRTSTRPSAPFRPSSDAAP